MSDAIVPDLQAEDWIVRESCPLCKAVQSDSVPFETVGSEIGELTYVICRRCGFVFQSPHPSRAWLTEYYRAGYHLHMHGRKTPGNKTEWVEIRRAEALLAFGRRHLTLVSHHLDVGSSLGCLLQAFREGFGCVSHGVEPAEVYRRTARELGVDVVRSLADIDPSLEHHFDLVSLSHVLEHMTDPLGTLRRLHHDWMASESHLLVEVPNLYGHPSLELAHLTAFTPDTLVLALRRAGFIPVAVDVHGQPHSRRLPWYIRALARRNPAEIPHPDPNPSLTWIRWRRRMGMFMLNAVWAASSRLLGHRRLTPWAK